MDALSRIGDLAVIYLTSIILVLVGLLLFVIGWFQGRTARAAKDWSTVTGEIMESSVEQYQYSGSEGTSTGWRPRIIYGYRVNGRDYVGERLNFGGEVHSSLRGRAESKSKQYATGKQVAVLYNPKDPSDAALERDTPSQRLLYIIGVVMLVVALLVCFALPIFTGMFTNSS